jgi:hypothetical protein
MMIRGNDLFIFTIKVERRILMKKSTKIIAGIGIGVLACTGAGLVFAGPIAAALGATSLLGAASTGTTIASLSGAALTNASLAALGGGAAVAGGGGMAAGTCVVVGSCGAIGAVAGAAGGLST